MVWVLLKQKRLQLEEFIQFVELGIEVWNLTLAEIEKKQYGFMMAKVVLEQIFEVTNQGFEIHQ